MMYRYSLRARKDMEQIYYYHSQKAGDKIARSIAKRLHNNVALLLNHPNLGYIEPQLEDFPQCFRTLTDVPNYKIIYWVEEDIVKIATIFDCRQRPEMVRYIIQTRTDWVCEPAPPPYGVKPDK